MTNKNHESLIERFNKRPDEEKTHFLIGLNRYWRKIILDQLSEQDIADILAYSDEDDAIVCLDTLSEHRRRAILQLLRQEKSNKIKLLLSFAPRTAGRLVDSNFIEVRENTTKEEIRRKFEMHYQQNKKPPIILVEDNIGKILGSLPVEMLLIDDWQTPASLKLQPLPTVSYDLPQKNLIEKVSGTSAKIIAVVDKESKTLGIIRTHNLMTVLEQKATDDFYKFAGVPPAEHIFDSPARAVKFRANWLILNLATAILAAGVVSLFKETISQVVILAAFMPVVAGMGGNAGTQTLAVMVRGIATGEIKNRSTASIISKEILAGLANGLINGLIIGVIAFLWQGNFLLGVVLFIAMVINLFVAGFFGTIIPLALKAIGVDPAIASSIFITTATDVIGFFAFLSLATWLLV